MSMLYPGMKLPKIGVPPTPTPRPPTVDKFAAKMVAQTRNPAAFRTQPGPESASVADQMSAQQQAFQGKLGELNDWSKNITSNMRAGTVNKRRVKEALYSVQNSSQNKFRPVQGSGANGAYVRGSAVWGGYRNGQIPTNALSRISFARGQMLRSDAAKGLEALNSAFRQQFGQNLGVGDSYRTIQRQVALARGPRARFAARPGTSVHGLGLALDLSGPAARPGSRQNQWLQQNARRFGYSWPSWARNPRRYEPWHWEYTG